MYQRQHTPVLAAWGTSSNGRANASHALGRGIDAPVLHNFCFGPLPIVSCQLLGSSEVECVVCRRKKACFQQIPVEFAVLELIEALCTKMVHREKASASGSAHAVKWNCFQHKEPEPTSHSLVVLSIVHIHFDSTEVSSSSSQQTNLQV